MCNWFWFLDIYCQTATSQSEEITEGIYCSRLWQNHARQTSKVKLLHLRWTRLHFNWNFLRLPSLISIMYCLHFVSTKELNVDGLRHNHARRKKEVNWRSFVPIEIGSILTESFSSFALAKLCFSPFHFLFLKGDASCGKDTEPTAAQCSTIPAPTRKIDIGDPCWTWTRTSRCRTKLGMWAR